MQGGKKKSYSYWVRPIVRYVYLYLNCLKPMNLQAMVIADIGRKIFEFYQCIGNSIFAYLLKFYHNKIKLRFFFPLVYSERKKMDNEVLKLTAQFYRENKSIVLGSIFLSIGSHIIETLVIPKLFAEILSSTDDKKKLTNNILLFLGAFAGEKAIEIYGHFIGNQIEPALTTFITQELVKGVFQKYESTHKPIQVAVVMERISIIRNMMEDLMYDLCNKLIPLGFTLIIAIFAIFKVNLKLGFCVFLCIILLAITLIYLPTPTDISKERDDVNDFVEDTFSNSEMISSTIGGVQKAGGDISNRVQLLSKHRKEYINRFGMNQMIGYAAATGMYGANLYCLYKLYTKGEIKLKDFESHILIIGRVYEIVYSLAYYVPSLYRNLQISNSSNTFIKELYSYKDKEGIIEASLKDGGIEFEHVKFSFGHKIILTNFSATINSGDLVSFYGTSGSGKTTFTNLIIDNLQPQEGRIIVGGYDIAKLSKKMIRKHIGKVQQNTTSLLQMTVYQNIIYGYEDCDELRSKVEDLITTYSIGSIFNETDFLSIKVEKGGCTLSGGQKQIIHLLHAAINPDLKVLILDEPTSALDTVSKGYVLDLISSLSSRGITVLIITHDPSVRDFCRTVIRFQEGSNPQV